MRDGEADLPPGGQHEAELPELEPKGDQAEGSQR